MKQPTPVLCLAGLCLAALLPTGAAIRSRQSSEAQQHRRAQKAQTQTQTEAEAEATALAEANANANPIRKVVTLLQHMQKKIETEGEREAELFEKFKCYCKENSGDLSGSVAGHQGKVPGKESEVSAKKGRISQLKIDLKSAQSDRSSAQETLREAESIRRGEAEAFQGQKEEYDAVIAQLTKAITALESGMAGAQTGQSQGSSFLQSADALALKKIAVNANIDEVDRRELVAFLAGKADSDSGYGYAPKSGQIVGILKKIRADFEGNLADATKVETGAIKSFNELSSAKTREVEALRGAIETKTAQLGDMGMDLVRMKEDLEDTESALSGDKKFLANLKEACRTKTEEYDQRKQTRADELVAIADTIKMLNNDDALDLFKKTLPSSASSFVQLSTSDAGLRTQALASLRSARDAAKTQNRAALDLLVLALTSRKALSHKGFEKVTVMIDNMVETLKAEQVDDDHKVDYCRTQLDHVEDKQKALQRSVANEENAVQSVSDSIETLTSEITALEAGIAELDKSVAAATEQRKQENAEYQDLLASDSQAKELLGMAKKRLNQFYNPKAVPETTNPPAEEAFVQVSMEQPPPPPETFGAYSKKTRNSLGVIGMIDALVKDLVKEMQEGKSQETTSQAEYEKLMRDSAEKRVLDSKALTEKGATKAELEESLESHKQGKADASSELMATEKYIASLHSECDWISQYYDVRKEARAGEADSLKKAKAVLSGADYSATQG